MSDLLVDNTSQLKEMGFTDDQISACLRKNPGFSVLDALQYIAEELDNQAPAPAAPAPAPAPEPPPYQIPPGQMEVTLQCPPNKRAGQSIQVKHPHTGQVFEVTVPPGTQPGTQFRALMPRAASERPPQLHPQQQPPPQQQQQGSMPSIPTAKAKAVVMKSIEHLNDQDELLNMILQLLNGSGKLTLTPMYSSDPAPPGSITISQDQLSRLQSSSNSGDVASAGGGRSGGGGVPASEITDKVNDWWGGGIGSAEGSSSCDKGGRSKGSQGGALPPAPVKQGTNIGSESAGVNAATGAIAGASTNFAQDFGVQTRNSADSGTFFRSKDWNDLVRQPKNERGPRQLGLREVVSLEERGRTRRQQQQEEKQNSQVQLAKLSAFSKGTNIRVNPLSKQRLYSMDGYEREAYIDPRRNLDDVIAKPGAAQKGQGQAQVQASEKSGAAVMVGGALLFESAAMGAKLRNTHKVGGERVKSMDHFVATVETPTETLQVPDIIDLTGEVSGTKGATVSLADATIKSQLQKDTSPVPLEVQVGTQVSVNGQNRHSVSVPFFVSTRFVKLHEAAASDKSGKRKKGIVVECPVSIRCYGHLLYRMLHYIYTELLQVPGMLSQVRLFYMTTMRANSSVAQASRKNGGHYYNAMVLQQMQCCEGAGLGGIDDERTLGQIALAPSLPAHEKKRVWLYWLQRASMLLPRKKGKTGSFAGLYDPGVRSRFRAFVARGFLLP